MQKLVQDFVKALEAEAGDLNFADVRDAVIELLCDGIVLEKELPSIIARIFDLVITLLNKALEHINPEVEADPPAPGAPPA